MPRTPSSAFASPLGDASVFDVLATAVWGLTVIVWPNSVPATHTVADGQASESSVSSWWWSIVTSVTGAGAWGSKVSSWPLLSSSAVHCVAVGQASSSIARRLPSSAGTAPAGADGLKVTSLVELTAVHWVTEAQATAVSPNCSPGSSGVVTAPEGDGGVKATTRLPLVVDDEALGGGRADDRIRSGLVAAGGGRVHLAPRRPRGDGTGQR